MGFWEGFTQGADIGLAVRRQSAAEQEAKDLKTHRDALLKQRKTEFGAEQIHKTKVFDRGAEEFTIGQTFKESESTKQQKQFTAQESRLATQHTETMAARSTTNQIANSKLIMQQERFQWEKQGQHSKERTAAGLAYNGLLGAHGNDPSNPGMVEKAIPHIKEAITKAPNGRSVLSLTFEDGMYTMKVRNEKGSA